MSSHVSDGGTSGLLERELNIESFFFFLIIMSVDIGLCLKPKQYKEYIYRGISEAVFKVVSEIIHA